MRSPAETPLAQELAGARRVVDAVRLYLGLLALVVLCIVPSIVGSTIALFMKPARRGPFARGVIRWIFGTHLRLMERCGVLRLDLSELHALQEGPATVLAGNHPSMIDAALFMASTDRLTCIMKASILNNPMFGTGARMAGYITNDPPKHMLRAAEDSLKNGRHLLLFPEGTRTTQLPVNPFQRTVGVVAKRAGVPVQTVLIETPSPFLCKGWPLLRVPAMPMVYRARLGKRFDAPTDVDAFTAELEAYFREQLHPARLPQLPLPRDAR